MGAIGLELTGQLGGYMSAAFGAGACAGYGFAIRTAYKSVKDRLSKSEADYKERLRESEKTRRDDNERCEMRITRLELRQRELEDMVIGRRALGFFSSMTGPPEKDHGGL